MMQQQTCRVFRGVQARKTCRVFRGVQARKTCRVFRGVQARKASNNVHYKVHVLN